VSQSVCSLRDGCERDGERNGAMSSAGNNGLRNEKEPVRTPFAFAPSAADEPENDEEVRY
jgi:hypothetical protein